MSTSTLKIGHLILCVLDHFVLVPLGAPRERKRQNHDHRYSQDPTHFFSPLRMCQYNDLAPASDQCSRPARFHPRLVVWKFCIVHTVSATFPTLASRHRAFRTPLRWKDATPPSCRKPRFFRNPIPQ